MSEEIKKVNGEGGTGSSGESKQELKSILDGIGTIKGVVSELATRVSDMERVQTESKELDEIMRGAAQDIPITSKVEGEGERANEGGEWKQAFQQLQQDFRRLSSSMSEGFSSIQVKQHEADPDFNATIRPLAFQVSKEKGKEGWPVEHLVEHAKGRHALRQVTELRKELTEKDSRLKGFEEKASLGEKPNFLFGATEPEKELNEDESFNKAVADSGLSGLPE